MVKERVLAVPDTSIFIAELPEATRNIIRKDLEEHAREHHYRLEWDRESKDYVAMSRRFCDMENIYTDTYLHFCETGEDIEPYIDMSVYVSIGTSDTYQQIAQILNSELMEKDAILSEYVSETNGIAAKFAVYDTIGRASAYFVNDGILYNISVGGFVDEDNVDPANYLKELIDTFK